MTRGRMLVLILVAGVAGAFGYAAWARADSRAAGCPPMGRYILVHDRASQCVIPIEKAEIQTIGGKQFLVGTGATIKGFKAPGTGRPVWVNLEDANTIVHFDCAEDVEKAIAAGQSPRDN
ncbi:MAG TPA: hypothetical protein VKD90_00130 [Gemmataceae bacterium]|nr:hypothetical protein [Gemmataceae bacterium]